MKATNFWKTTWILSFAVILVATFFYFRPKDEQPQQLSSDVVPTAEPASIPSNSTPAAPIQRAGRDAAMLAKIRGITNFSALNSNQVQHFHQIVAPGVSNFISVLQKFGVSRFDNQTIGPGNFVSLHDPKPGNIWDLRVKGNNDRDYFMRFNQTHEMGIIGGLTNVVSFFPIAGPSIQSVMEGFLPDTLHRQSSVEVQPRSDSSPEDNVKNLSRQILSALGNNTESFIEVSTTTERSSGIKGGYVTTFRPKGLDQPDNALYDTTFGFVVQDGRFVLDTFTYNSGRLLPPARQNAAKPKPAVPQF